MLNAGRLARSCMDGSLEGRPKVHGLPAGYHTAQTFAGRMGAPSLQAKASAKAGTSASTPFTRKRGGECGFVFASSSRYSGRSFSHHDWPYARKKSWSSV